MFGIRRTSSTVDSLAEIAFLRGCPRRDLETLDRCTTTARVRAGTTLCREGDLGREAFLILDGDADVVVDGTTIAHLTAGDVCGETALLDRVPRSATVTAVTPMTVLAMSSNEFKTIVSLAPSISQRLSDTSASRNRAAPSR